MLKQLFIRNFALIDLLDIEFRPGFSVITGETGAGKSIILGAIGLLLGQRADSKTLKQGADKCVIEAHFDLSRYQLEPFFQQNDIEYDAEDCIIRRELTATGKSRSFINDTPVALSLLKELGERLVDVHSQHQNLLLGKHDFQLSVVDIIGADQQLLADYQQSYGSYLQAVKRLEQLRQEIEQGRQQLDFMQFQYEELSNARLSDGEQEELEQRSDAMTHSEDIKQALYQADETLSGDARGVVATLRQAATALRGIERVYPDAGELAGRIESCHIELKDIAQEVSRLLDDIDFNPAELDSVNARLDKIYDLQKKYHATTVGELLLLQADLQQKLSDIDNSDEALATLQDEVARLQADCNKKAAALTTTRRKAAKQIEQQMLQRLEPLGMPHVRFQVSITTDELGRMGQDKVAFLFSANTSTPLQPVSQVASGGEIARVMLALKAMISGAVKLPTIIFDEIDTGVSGKIAEQMARIMYEMGQSDRQVISITHLPQIAAMGATHYKVYKEETPQGTISHMQMLGDEERVAEVAQMLSGSAVSQEAVANARSLLGAVKRCIVLLLTLVATGWITGSQAEAQSWVKKASKGVFMLKTFKADGQLLGSSTGFFVDEEGTALSSFTPFRGATRAVVIDAQGKEWPVDAMVGANETYDVAKFRVKAKKTTALDIARQTATQGAEAWLLPYHETKQVPHGQIRRVEQFGGSHAYYTVNMPVGENMVSCPLLNEQGEVLGLMQLSASATDTLGYAVSALFADSLQTTGLSLNDKALRATGLKIALPTQIDQALLMLYMGASAADSASYAAMIDDFIEQFPQAPDGYTYRARLAATADRYDAASHDMEKAISVAEKKDEAHYSYAQLIYQKEIYKPQSAYAPWSLDKALQEAELAYSINPLPLYRYQRGQVLYAQKKYGEAFAVYEELTHTTLRSAEVFFEASRCKEQLRDTTAQLALLDSALATFSQPYLQEAAPYLLARAQVRLDVRQYRPAVTDLNDYERLMRARLNDRFYYIRFQAEVGGRLFQQALDDIDKAIEMNPTYDLYVAEKASLQVRLGLYDEAIATAQACIQLAPNYSDGYLFLGLAQCLKGQKEEGLANLRKASELGDTQAAELIDKYSK